MDPTGKDHANCNKPILETQIVCFLWNVANYIFIFIFIFLYLYLWNGRFGIGLSFLAPVYMSMELWSFHFLLAEYYKWKIKPVNMWVKITFETTEEGRERAEREGDAEVWDL